jgi:uncharacterized membrane protein
MPFKAIFFANAKMKMRMHFLTGLLVCVPMAITILSVEWIDTSITNVMDRLLMLLPVAWAPEQYLPSKIPGLGIVITLLIIYAVGVFCSVYLGRMVVQFYERLLTGIPGVRWFYAVAKQLMEGIFKLMKEFRGEGADRFRGVVLLEYPRKGIYSLAFVTGDTMKEVTDKVGVPMVNIFIPTSPNPTSGFYLMVPKTELIPLELPVDKAFKLIVSAGMVGGDGSAAEQNKARSEAERAGSPEKKGGA